MIDTLTDFAKPPRQRIRQLWWLVTSIHCLLLVISLSRFLLRPDSRLFGVAWNALYQIHSPTIGSLVITILLASEILAGRLRVVLGVGLILAVLIVSAVCLYWSYPILVSV